MSQATIQSRVAAPMVVVFGILAAACAPANLRRMVANGDLAATRVQIEQKGQSPESPDECGWTLLHHASYYQHTPLVEYLVARSANVNARTTLQAGHCIPYSRIAAGSTPLIIAAYYGQADILQILLAHGADRSIKNDDGYDALTFARKFEFGQSVRVLEGEPGDTR
jgi:uncharacterized protein